MERHKRIPVNSKAKTYCFEPDAKNRTKVERHLASFIKDGIASIVPFAAWNRKENLHFHENGNGVSKVAEDGITVNASTIDSVIPESEKVTFIKMDIEGAELRALKGAEKTISKNHPKLAISAYHKPEDIITLADGETVLYGICFEKKIV